MTQQGATLQNYNNELVKCAFAYFRIFWRHQTLADRAADTPILLFILFQALRTCARSARRSTGRSRRMRRRRVRAAAAPSALCSTHTRYTRGSYSSHGSRSALLSSLAAAVYLRSQDPERPSDPDRAARAHQRQPRAQDHLAQRVRQNHPGDGGRLLEGACPPLPLPAARRCWPAGRASVLTLSPVCRADYGELANAAARAQARERQPHEEKAGLVVSGGVVREVERAASARTRMVVAREGSRWCAGATVIFIRRARVDSVCGAQTLTECVCF